MTCRKSRRPKLSLARDIDRWLTVMALSLEGLGWPTAADLWLAELSRELADNVPTPDQTSTQSPDTAPEGEPR